MRITHLLLLLVGVALTYAGPSNVRRRTGSTKDKIENLCARMHNNTAFIGAQPFARLSVDSASKCQKNCMELHPKCIAVIFYYVYGEKSNHICFLFDKNSVSENVALVPEKPKNTKDVVRALEIVTNCHEFDPFPPLPDPFVFSSDIVGRDKRAVGFDKPIKGTGPWTPWSSCNRANTQIRSQTCEYGRKIQKRQCAPRYPQQTSSFPAIQLPTAAPAARYPPPPYDHPSVTSPEYARRMEEHKRQELQLCCYKLQTEGAQVHHAIPSATPCPQQCPVDDFPQLGGASTSFVTPRPPDVYGWQQWSDWSLCSVSCGTGQMTRSRECTSHTAVCLGSKTESRECIKPPCAGVWGMWCEWSPCSASCGMGKRERSRHCETGFLRCEGIDHQDETCNAGPCPEWMPWSEWGMCSASCGGGMTQRYRVCSVGSGCPGSHVEEMACNEQPCACWGEWTPYSECSVTCGEGTKTRSRYCENGNYCEGKPMETLPCQMPPCAEWSPWNQWSQCSVTCGPGTQTRHRECIGGSFCPGNREETKPCMLGPCPTWTQWMEWSQCSVTCGQGEQTRRRFCSNGGGCPGQAEEVRPCQGPPCAKWGEWEPWSQCSVSCGSGTRSRVRECIGGDYCEGERDQTEHCNNGPCPQWAEWNQWTPCPVTCGEGIQTRSRYCMPGVGGECIGSREETKPCYQGPCPTWEPWGPWSQCSVTCGTGTRYRQRTCLGQFCEGEDRQTERCDMGMCPHWSEWNPWGACSVTCGDGMKTRTRYCIGSGCIGPNEETQPCYERACPSWGQWEPWSQCSVTCGPGQKTRTRMCLAAGFPSEGCPGLSSESTTCDAGPCCHWSEWCGWSICDRDCGGGKKIRQRLCVRPLPNGEVETDPSCGCPGPDKEIQDCNQHKCKPQCAWTQWCPWSNCGDKDPCKNATMTRTRQCVGESGCICYGFAEEKQFCRHDTTCDLSAVPTNGIRRRRHNE